MQTRPKSDATPGLNARVTRVESLPPECEIALDSGGSFLHRAEDLEGSAETLLRRADGLPALCRAGKLRYLAGWPADDSLHDILRALCRAQGIGTTDLPEGMRRRDAGIWRFWFNHTPDPVSFEGRRIAAAGVLRETRS